MTAERITIHPDKVRINPYQHRTQIDPNHAQDLAQSIKEIGLIQIPVGRYAKEGRKKIVELAAGAHRLEAFKILLDEDWRGAQSFPVDIQELTDEQMFRVGLAENRERLELTPIDEANAIRIAREDFGLTFDEIAELLGYGSGSTVRDKIRLLDLPEPVQDLLESGEVTEGAARTLLSMKKVIPEKDLIEFAQKQAADAPSVTVVKERALRKLGQSKSTKEMWGTYTTGQGTPPRGGVGLFPLSWTFKRGNGKVKISPAQFLKAYPVWDDLETIFPEKRYYVEDWDNPRKAIKELFRTLIGDNDIAGRVSAETDDFLGDIAFETGAALDLVELLDHYADPPPCLSCPMHTQIEKEHYCGSLICWKMKRASWIEKELEEVSKELDLPVYDPQVDGSHYETASWHSWWKSEADRAKEKRFAEWVADLQAKKKGSAQYLRLKKQTNQTGTHPFTNSRFVVLVSTRPELAKLAKKAGSSQRRIDDIVEDLDEHQRKLESELARYWRDVTKAWAKITVAPLLGEAIEKELSPAYLAGIGMIFRIPEELEDENPFAEANARIWADILGWKLIDDVVNWEAFEKGPKPVLELITERVEPMGIALPEGLLLDGYEFTQPAPEIIEKICTVKEIRERQGQEETE